MKILMLSIDKGLLGKGQLGDVVERHERYGKSADRLDIIVFCKKGFSENRISDNVSAWPTNSKNKCWYFFDGFKVGRALFSKNNYDLIVTQEPFVTGLVGYMLKRKFGAKLLVHFHGDFFSPKWLAESPRNKLFLILGKFLARRADAIRSVSSGIKESLVKKVGIKETKIRVISTPVSLERFEEVDEKIVLDFKTNFLKGHPTILHVGREDPAKDFETLTKTFALVLEKKPEVRLLQLGRLNQNIKFSEIKEKLKLFDSTKEPLAGPKLAITDLPIIYSAVDLLVSSSTHESFGKVLVEANAAGRPVVATATTGAKDIVKDGYNGFLVPIGDAEALAQKILYLLDNPEEAKKIGENGRKLVWKNFSGQANTQKIINFWQDISAGKL
ncbi:MAG: glycosyltransferase family 4 protein [bacterium]